MKLDAVTQVYAVLRHGWLPYDTAWCADDAPWTWFQ